MSDLRLRLPDSLHRKLREIADKDDVSINQFIATAVAEKAAAYLTVEYLEERAHRAKPALFDRLLDRVPDAVPVAGDELRPRIRRPRRQAARGRSKARRS
jgi:predicted transcriptional regulator